MDLQAVLSQVITSTNEIFEAEAGSVALLEPNGDFITIQAAVGAGAEAVRGLTLPVTKGVIGWVVSHKEPALISDVRTDNRFNQEVDKESGFHTRSILCVPLKVGEHTIGVIELMNMSPDYLSENGLKILRVIADHAALAIENAQLLAATQRRSEEQAMLFEAMTMVTSDLELETVLDAVSRQVAEVLQADLCMISDWNQTENVLQTTQCYTGPGATMYPQVKRRSLAEFTLFHSILISQTPTLLEVDAENISPAGIAWLQALNVEVLLVIPLMYRRRTIGLVEIGRVRTTAPLTANELRLAEMMTAQAAVVIEHARLYDEAMHRLAEAKVLQEVMVAAASSLDFDQVLSGTIDALHRTLGVERLGFFLPAEDDTSIFPHPATVGFQLSENMTIPIDGSAAGWVFRNRKPCLIVNVDEAEHYYQIAPDTASELCVPVMVNDKVAAVLNAESPRLNAFDPHDSQFFMAIAAELGVALKNADLFEEIRKAEAGYRDLFDNANDFILTLDSDFRVRSANKMALKSTGYQLKEIVGAHVTRFIAFQYHNILFYLLKEHLISPEARTTFELPILSKDGEEILLDITFRVRPEEHQAATVHCIGRDITHRRELEQELQQTEKLSAIGKLVAGVAHELNNPLTSIIGFSTMLQQDDLPAAYREDLDVIFRQAERARLIVRDLLTFARRFELETEPVDLNDIVHRSLTAVKHELQAKSVQVLTTLDFGLPKTMADPRQLEQVFVNLITNAIQALAQVTTARRIIIETQHLDRAIQLRFSDNGPGIPQKIINRIFDPFFSTKDVGEGTGLGLSICFGIILEHKGQIHAENNPDGGATFVINLPINAPVPVNANPLPITVPQPAPLTGLKILAVDDEIPLLKLLHRVLTQQGHNVDTAPDGNSALRRLKEGTYDLVICDMIMPDILGTELYERVSQEYPTMAERFVFITGNVVDRDTRLFLEKSGLPWLSKPFLPSDIETIVRQAVNPSPSLAD